MTNPIVELHSAQRVVEDFFDASDLAVVLHHATNEECIVVGAGGGLRGSERGGRLSAMLCQQLLLLLQGHCGRPCRLLFGAVVSCE
jgi:hypothetical protein